MSFTELVQRLGARPWFAAVGPRAVYLDRLMGRLTGGRFLALGLPSLLLTTTGRRSGLPRTQTLLYATDGDGYVVVASNWGQPHHPAWSLNLLDNPVATVALRGRRIRVHAVLATGAQR